MVQLSGTDGSKPEEPSALPLGRDRSAPRRARDHVYDLLQCVPDAPQFSEDDLFDVLLCTSELVNAALLGGSSSMTLEVHVDSGCLRVTLSDDTPGVVAPLESARAQEHCLRVVANLADRWNSEVNATARITTAEFNARRSRRRGAPSRG